MTNQQFRAFSAFRAALVADGLLNPLTGGKLVKGISGEDWLLAQWRAKAARFVCRGLRVTVDMRIDRLSFGESRCTLVIAAA